MKTKEEERIIVLCVSDTDRFRGPVTAAFFNEGLKGLDVNLVAESAGIKAKNGATASTSAIETMFKFHNIEIKNHLSRNIKSIEFKKIAYFVCMNQTLADAVIALGVNKARVLLLGQIFIPEAKKVSKKFLIDLIKEKVSTSIGFKR